ncbi:RNase RNM [Motilimonas eburnea]|uniref:RNase RNM n=1 Tax=Motilimonas eburnea TaxID=1737488 RepID=UPI001E475CE4|nr:PHP domain-containing protein [Motilimonas eburnea]MCE2570012.1 PHP domain-containing protein [Motilimonas eburnea]
MLVDFHSHTRFSDGLLSPKELVQRAVDRRVDVLAITDHDTTAGIAPARAAIAELALPLTLIDGIEISSGWQNHEIHVVGLRLDITDPALQAFIQGQSEKREARAIEMGRRLEKNRLAGCYEGAKALAGEAQVTRAHFARYMVEQGIVDSFQQVFKKYLTRGNPGYVPHNWPDMTEAIGIIKQAGGVAVLAHPTHYKLSNKWLKRLLHDFKAAGGDALEVAMSQQSPQDRINLAQWGNAVGLKASQGSDFHLVSSWSDLGRNLYLPKDAEPIWQDWPELTAVAP